MKRMLLPVLLAGSFMLLLSSCQKFVVKPSVPALSGNWYLQDASRYDSYKWQHITTGYENGTFSFRGNGDVSYRDALGTLRGNWSMYSRNDSYYDGNGRYTNGYHVMFSLQLYEAGNGNPAADWLFDDNDYDGGNVFRATYTSGNYTYEYTFARE